jgi:Protein of unknown function (DUF1036)
VGLYFKNATVSPIWVIYGYEAPGCEGGVDWAKSGWYEIAPASTVKVRSGWVGGDCWMYYAEDDFGHVWAGPYNTFVPWNSFDWCWNTASTSGKTVGMRIFCLDWDVMDHTKILTL